MTPITIEARHSQHLQPKHHLLACDIKKVDWKEPDQDAINALLGLTHVKVDIICEGDWIYDRCDDKSGMHYRLLIATETIPGFCVTYLPERAGYEEWVLAIRKLLNYCHDMDSPCMDH